jgi:pimeloyl-ACP methyl ester carboxylesterase
MVWLPGWSTGPDVWRREVERWSAARHVLVDLDGESPGMIQARADEAVRGAARGTIVIGWSLGAMAALDAVRRLRPAGIRLALVGATARFVRDDGKPWGWPPAALRRMQRRLLGDQGQVLQEFDKQLFSPTEVEAGAHDRWAREQGARCPRTASLAAGLEYLRGFTFDPEAADLQAPISLLHGGDDEICPPAGARGLAAALPEANLTVVEGAGHAPFWTRPEEFHGWLRNTAS